jgi:hypothetical protein
MLGNLREAGRLKTWKDDGVSACVIIPRNYERRKGDLRAFIVYYSPAMRCEGTRIPQQKVKKTAI